MNQHYHQIVELLKANKEKCLVYHKPFLNFLSFKIKPFKTLILDLDYGNIHIQNNNEIGKETHCKWYFLDGEPHPEVKPREIENFINELELTLKND